MNYRLFRRYYGLAEAQNDVKVMIAVIKGDIVESRKLNDPGKWIKPLKNLFSEWGETPGQWELVWGDSFQLEIDKPEDALHKAFEIKALIKEIGTIDVRMSIGIGEKTFEGARISESNGPAFVYAGEKFDKLKKEKINMAVQSSWQDFDREINLYLRLAGTFMDHWSVSSAELMEIVLHRPEATQEEIGRHLGIKQNTVSDRWGRANVNEIQEIDKAYRSKLQQLM